MDRFARFLGHGEITFESAVARSASVPVPFSLAFARRTGTARLCGSREPEPASDAEAFHDRPSI